MDFCTCMLLALYRGTVSTEQAETGLMLCRRRKLWHPDIQEQIDDTSI